MFKVRYKQTVRAYLASRERNRGRERERRVRVYKEAPGFRPGPRDVTTMPWMIPGLYRPHAYPPAR